MSRLSLLYVTKPLLNRWFFLTPSQIPEPVTPVEEEIERPKSPAPWTPSYSVSRQGTSPLSSPQPSQAKELPAPAASLVTVTSDSPVEEHANAAAAVVGPFFLF